MKTLHLAAIIVSMFLMLFVTGHAYAPCIEGPGINCNNYPTQTLSQIHFDKINYEIQDKPIITISGVPSTAIHLEIDDSSSNIMFEHDLNLSLNGTARYVLDISYYKIGGYSATATSLMSKVTTGFTVGMTPSGGNMALSVDKNSYLPGEKISILGTGNSNTLIQLSLIDPYGTSIRSAKIFSDKTGHFSSSNFTIPNNAVSGIWQIGATGGVMHVRTQIVVNSTNNPYGIDTNKAITPSPLKQFRSGIAVQDVKCREDLMLVIKTDDGYPACVTSQTAQKLVERGWVTSTTDLKPWMKIDTSGLNATYVVNQPISFSVAVKGFGNYPCVSPQIKIHDNKNPNVPIFQDNGSTMSCPALGTPDNYSFDFPGSNSHYVIILNKTGDYTMTISYGDNSVQKYFSIVLPSNPQNITILENNAGIVLLNQPYYFETPNYTNDAYTHPVQVSFHDVLFTLFPPGFRGGLPAGGCMEKGPGLGQYYWTDAKFEDDTHELLHIFADSPSCTGSIPTMFSNHTNPQAGLTFYDGKMKLLVSTNVRDSTEKHNIAIQSLGQTPNVSNKTDNTKLRVYFSGGSGSVNMGSDKFNQTGFFFGNVGQVIKGLPVKVSISDPYDMFIRQYEISSNNISQDGSFNFTHTFLGKYDQDVYTLDFSYSNQRYELKYYPVVPP